MTLSRAQQKLSVADGDNVGRGGDVAQTNMADGCRCRCPCHCHRHRHRRCWQSTVVAWQWRQGQPCRRVVSAEREKYERGLQKQLLW